MIQRIQNLNERTVLIVLVLVAVVSLGLSALSHWLNGENAWWGWADSAFQNFSTEMMGAILTFALFELVIGVRNEKKNLLLLLRSKDSSTVLNALDQIKENGWDRDGTLKGLSLRFANLQDWTTVSANLQGSSIAQSNLQNTGLIYANLEGANLIGSDFRNSDLRGANLSGARLDNVNFQKAHLWEVNLQGGKLKYANLQFAKLWEAKLQGADLRRTSLREADLKSAQFDEKTILPDATHLGDDTQGNPIYDKYWTPETDMSRYTDPNHPDFWQPDWAKEQDAKKD